MQEVKQANKRIQQMVFPKLDLKVQEEPKEENYKVQRFDQADLSLSYLKEYDQLNYLTKNKGQTADVDKKKLEPKQYLDRPMYQAYILKIARGKTLKEALTAIPGGFPE